MGAPRPAASPFLAHDHCARYGCERSPSRQAKTIHFRRRRWLSSRRAEVARSPIGKKIAFVQCAASAASVLLRIQHGAQESNISPRLLLKGHRIRSVKAVVF